MREFILTSKSTERKVKIKLDLKGNLIGFEFLFEIDMEGEQRDNFYYTIFTMLINNTNYNEFSNNKKWKFEEIDTDISFINFWNRYNNKTGKVTCEKAYNKLKDNDKKLAILGIKQYDKHLLESKIAKKHPTTYLNQKQWEDYT